MRKDTNHYDTSKLVVDFYHPKDNGDFVCSCYTPGADSRIEQEYLVKTVTYQEMKDHIADGNGMVNVCFFMDEGATITFDQYLSGLNHRTIEWYCADIINKRERRTHLYNFPAHQLQKAS